MSWIRNLNKFLLGSASGFAAVITGHAADIPIKGKPVEYVRVCSLYGAGFYYIPGTDICMKVGGYVRFQQNFANGGGNPPNGAAEGTPGRNTRSDSSDLISRSRAVASFDTRQQTGFGAIRTYLMLGFQQETTAGPPTASPIVYIPRGFVQIAGFTFGKATSYYDFFSRRTVAYHAGTIFAFDSVEQGEILAAYTAQFGGGVSGSISLEHSRRRATVYTGTANSFSLGWWPVANNLSSVNNTASGNPDIVANLRWDGAWGAFQLAGVLHDVSGSYYGTVETAGHPSNRWGWGVSPGVRINAPVFGSGDYFMAVASYTQGAATFAASPNAFSRRIGSGGQLAFGFVTDGVYGGTVAAGTATDVQLTTAWSAAAAYEHFLH
jgi:hypothetical protein